MLFVIIYTHFSILRLGMVHVLQVLDHFALTLTLVECIFDSPQVPQSCYTHGREEEQKNDEPASTMVYLWRNQNC